MLEREPYDSGLPEVDLPEVETPAADSTTLPRSRAVEIRRPEDIASEARLARMAAIRRSLKAGMTPEPEGVAAEVDVAELDVADPEPEAAFTEMEFIEAEPVIAEPEVLDAELVAPEPDLDLEKEPAFTENEFVESEPELTSEPVEAEFVEPEPEPAVAEAELEPEPQPSLAETELLDTELAETELLDTEPELADAGEASALSQPSDTDGAPGEVPDENQFNVRPVSLFVFDEFDTPGSRDDEQPLSEPAVPAPGPVSNTKAEGLPIALESDSSELEGGPLSVSPLEGTPPSYELERDPNRGAIIVFAAAVGLAVLSGILATLWLRERSAANDLRNELVAVEAGVEVTDLGLGELNDEVETLQLRNEQLEQQLNDMSALVLELPAGRVTEIDVPFTPVLADEENNRLIAMSDDGAFIVWGEGADGPITDSGGVSGSPTGLFASLRKAWVSTDAGRIEILSLANEEDGPAVEFGPTAFLAAEEERGYWTYNSDLGEIVRLRKADGGITAGVAIPVDVVDLTIGAGSVWALGDDGRVYRVNTADFTIQAFDAGEDLIAITAGPDSLWTLSAADGALRRVDPVSGEVLVTVPVGRDPIDAAFAGSSVWVGLRAGSSLIEVDTRTSAVISRTMMPSEPTALHQGDTGVFVTMEGEVPLVRVSSLLIDEDEDVDEGAADEDTAEAEEPEAG